MSLSNSGSRQLADASGSTRQCANRKPCCRPAPAVPADLLASPSASAAAGIWRSTGSPRHPRHCIAAGETATVLAQSPTATPISPGVA